MDEGGGKSEDAAAHEGGRGRRVRFDPRRAAEPFRALLEVCRIAIRSLCASADPAIAPSERPIGSPEVLQGAASDVGLASAEPGGPSFPAPAASGMAPSSRPRGLIQSPGISLDPRVRTFMEARFGQDFGAVRIHNEARDQGGRSIDSCASFHVGSRHRLWPRRVRATFGRRQARPGPRAGPRGSAAGPSPQSDVGAPHSAPGQAGRSEHDAEGVRRGDDEQRRAGAARKSSVFGNG